VLLLDFADSFLFHSLSHVCYINALLHCFTRFRFYLLPAVKYLFLPSYYLIFSEKSGNSKLKSHILINSFSHRLLFSESNKTFTELNYCKLHLLEVFLKFFRLEKSHNQRNITKSCKQVRKSIVFVIRFAWIWEPVVPISIRRSQRSGLFRLIHTLNESLIEYRIAVQ